MIKKTLLAAVLVLPALSACGDPCASLPPASQAERDILGSGAEIEREGKRDAECELQRDGSWEQD